MNRSAVCCYVVQSIVLLLLACDASGGELRVWTSIDGGHTTLAELVRLDGEVVVLRKTNGREISVPLARLSSADRRFAQGQSSSRARPETAVGERREPESRGGKSQRSSESQRVTTAAGVEAEAQAMATGEDGLLVYQLHLAGDELPPSERRKVEARLEHWRDLADAGRVRLGGEWVSKEEAKEARKAAKARIDEGFEMLRLGNGELAEEAFDAASRINPGAADADFFKGLVYGLVANNDREAAECFAECVEREPSNAAARNNLGVSLFMCRRYSQAIDQWIAAANLSPEADEIANNLGCLIAMQGRGLRAPKKKVQAAAAVYQRLITEFEHERPRRIFLRYVPPGEAGLGYLDEERTAGELNGDLITIGSGSGFVVSRGMVVTNHHVIEGGDGLLVLDPKDPNNRLPATVVAADERLDVALLRCADLDAPPVPVSTRLPSRGADVMVLGYPLGLEFGAGLKATRGSMVAMPDAKNEGLCLYDALTNPGNSGGPLCDRGGRVVGVVRAITGYIGGVYGGAIPMGEAVAFLDRHLPGLDHHTQSPAELAWTEVDARVSQSTVLILNRQRKRTCKPESLGRGIWQN
ncbi:MAG: trypsin-like peptidase domain-containing protein [Planctomycetota bacterium]